MITVAIIDDGIDQLLLPPHTVIETIDFTDNDNPPRGQHGSRCAQIVYGIEKNVQFVSINIINENHKGNISLLYKALKWCLFHNINIINMSLGTLNYHEGIGIAKIITELSEKGTLIVAAYHNSNMITYPAALPRVFGVRQDRNNTMSNYEHVFSTEKLLNEENQIVVHYDGGLKQPAVYYTISNSLAAPVITGKLAAEINKRPMLSFEGAKDLLLKSQLRYAFQLSKVNFARYLEAPPSYKPETPLIYIPCELLGDFSMLLEKYEYKYEILMWRPKPNNIIPLEYYWPCKSIDKFLFTLETIYYADLFIITGQIPTDFPLEFFQSRVESKDIVTKIRYGEEEYSFKELNKSLNYLLSLLEQAGGRDSHE